MLNVIILIGIMLLVEQVVQFLRPWPRRGSIAYHWYGRQMDAPGRNIGEEERARNMRDLID